MTETSGFSGRGRPGSRRRLRTRLLLGGSCLAALALAAGPAVADSTPGAALSTVAASPAPPVAPDNPRPASCPPVPSNQGGPDSEAQTTTGVPLWPAAPPGTNPEDYASYLHTPQVTPPLRPANWADGGGDWKLTSARSTDPQVADNPQELCGVEGNSVDKAWQVTTGRPDTVIAITDSGIEWCDPSVVDKIALNRYALPYPENAAGLTKPQLEARGVVFADSDPYDLDNSGILDAEQYASDPRVAAVVASSPSHGFFCGKYISPEDLIRTFGSPSSPYYYPHPTAGAEAPPYPGQVPAGFTEAIAGWNFVDDTNDPYDDVLYGHGTGEAEDATGSADAVGKEVGTCPSCTVLPIRVGESFIASSNDFARGVLFAVDSGASVVQEALGTLDVTTTAAQAIAYANSHGVPVISSAADEEAEHHNEPADLPGTIVVNSVTQAPSETVGGQTVSLYQPPSYLYLNGCTNYGANIAVSVESASCSSEATGKTGGVTGLIESEAKNLLEAGRLAPYPGLKTVGGAPVALSATEVRELIEMSADDVDFQTPVLPSPSSPFAAPPDNYAVVAPVPTTRYPTQPGFDMYTGYGRLDAANILDWLAAGKIPPEASFGEMQWFQTYDPAQALSVPLFAAAVRTPGPYHWKLQYGIGTQPEPGAWYDITGGSGSGGPRGSALEENYTLSPSLLAHIASQLPPSDHGTGPDGRPEPDADSFTLRLLVADSHGLVGMDRRTEYLQHDPTLVTKTVLQPGVGAGVAGNQQPATSFGGSIDAAPTLAPIGPGGTDALIVATADGTIHAYTAGPDGTLSELPGWPVHTALLPGQAELSAHEAAYTSGQVTAIPHCSIVGGVAVGRLMGAHAPPDVVASDMCGNVYAWDAAGTLLAGFPVHTDPVYSQDPAPYAGTATATDPSVDPRDPDNRLLPGILGAPALADLTGSGQLDIVVSSLDRHVYAWTPGGQTVPGYPVLVVDPAQVASVDPVTNHVDFKTGVNVQMGSMILDTPAVGRLSGGGGPPDLVIGTDEEYGCNPASLPGAGLAEKPGEPGCAISEVNALNWALDAAGASLLNPANSMVYALAPAGTGASADCSEGTAQPDACAILPGWPAEMVDLDAGLLPDVADGTTAPPALADLSGNGTLDVGDMTSVGPAYIFGPNGKSIYGDGPDGQPIGLSMSAVGPLANSQDVPSIPALGMPVFAPLGGAAPGTSFIAPAASLGKALDAALPAEQYANDNQLDAWNTSTATMQAAFPQVMNDLQFFDQPIVADVGGAAGGAYVVEGSANADLRAVNSYGQEAPGFPKFTGGWIVNSPSFGPLGSLRDQVVVAGTRDGDLFVWSTPTPRCAGSGPWPRQHHDLSNTNDLQWAAALRPSCS
ncbi:MAG TPA: S8 family serine peptidase [Acidimicrobiales bacterium]|nr:S8 family serine peptidase [Acidimicrobiales bacterium]